MASNSTVEIPSGKLETKREKHSCLSVRILGGSGLYLAPSLEDLGLSLRSSEEPKDQTRLLPFLLAISSSSSCPTAILSCFLVQSIFIDKKKKKKNIPYAYGLELNTSFHNSSIRIRTHKRIWGLRIQLCTFENLGHWYGYNCPILTNGKINYLKNSKVGIWKTI